MLPPCARHFNEALPRLQKGVVHPLFADGGGAAVPGEDVGFVGEGEEFLADGFHEGGVIAAG